MNSLLLAFYGDDFTGSTDAMEVLQWSGLRTVLFLEPPTAEQLAAYPGLRAFGVAGWSRTMSTQEMDQELPAVFESLKRVGAKLIHYKVCSTFDSSNAIGSIGRALDIGRRVIGNSPIPIVVGAPNLGRYQVFGNLFARSGLATEPYRLDRHPTMAHHPITPMGEADLRRVLASQTDCQVGLVDVVRLQAQSVSELRQHIEQQSCEAVLFDLLDAEHLAKVGDTLGEMCRAPVNFIVGSSGVEYALTASWRQSGRLADIPSRPDTAVKFGPASQVLVLTGSCSPVNARQIAWAEQHGFDTLPIDLAGLVRNQGDLAAIEDLVARGHSKLAEGKSLILYSSLGPAGTQMAQTLAALRERGLSEHEIKLKSGRILGPLLGEILVRFLKAWPLPRVGVAGGDTSGYIARALEIEALEAIAHLAPGSPLCTVHSRNAFKGLEIIFKGGQVGQDDVWGTLLHGTLGTSCG